MSEKGGKMVDGEIPDLGIQVGASNCQYYNDVKGYERALRDILHCVTLFR